MSTALDFYNSDKVQYKCTCGVFRLMSKLYFCRHCLELRCGNCVYHEVDSFFCPNCEENIPSAEAKHKKYRCMNCWVCPSCSHTLVTRASSILIPAPDDPSKTIPKKVYFLVCGFCRWTSRDVDIPDQSTASGGWQDLENPRTERINKLTEYYQALSLKEKLDKEKKAVRKSKYLSLVSKSSMLSTARRRSNAFSAYLRDKEIEVVDIIPAVASEKVEELPDSCYEDMCLTSVCNISQRHKDPVFQQEEKSKMYPHHIGLLIKQSKRCKICEHNLIKPEFNPTSIKFKIQLSAYYHIPEIKIMKLPELSYQKPSKLILTLCNPTQHELTITVTGLKSTDDPDDPDVNADLDTPPSELMLGQRDDTAEFDDVSDAQSFKDDPEVVMYRKANRIGFYCTVTPQIKSGTVKVKLHMKYNCTITTIILPPSEPKEPQVVPMDHVLELELGQVTE
ncbi:Dynactin subunit 4 [Nymphon striatum]|nr:Dynactin subunit 4 [Nymphon striatum]